jgi:hypothetical protein
MWATGTSHLRFVGFSRNSVSQFLTRSCRAGVSVVQVGSVTVALRLRVWMNLYPYWLLFLTDLGEIRYNRCPSNTFAHLRVVKVRVGEATLLEWTLMKLHVHAYRETAWHSDSKERLDKVCVLRNGVCHVQCCMHMQWTRAAEIRAILVSNAV